jgi:hypothetical protein
MLWNPQGDVAFALLVIAPLSIFRDHMHGKERLREVKGRHHNACVFRRVEKVFLRKGVINVLASFYECVPSTGYCFFPYCSFRIARQYLKNLF